MNGDIVIFNQDGVKQAVSYTDKNVNLTTQEYLHNNNVELTVTEDSDDGDTTCCKSSITTDTSGTEDKPLKYCVSKESCYLH